MDTPSEHGGSDRRARLLKAGALLAVLIVILAAAAWLLSPRLTEYLLEQQLDELQERTGLDIEAQSLQTTGLEGVEIRSLVLTAPGDDEPLVVIDEIDAAADLWQAARGRPAITDLRIRGVDLRLQRYADGTTNLDVLRRRDDDDDDEEEVVDDFLVSVEDVLEDLADRVLVHFGGTYPEVLIEDVDVAFHHHSEAEAWLVDSVTMERFTLSGGDDAEFATEVEIASRENEAFRLPEWVGIEGTARRPVARSTVAIDIAPDIRITDLPGLPYVELGLSAVELPEPYAVELHAPVVDTRLSDTPFQLGSAERIRVDLSQWSLDPSELSITDLQIESPRLHIEYNEAGASNLQQLHTILRQPQAATVARHATEVGESIVALDEDDEEDSVAEPSAGFLHRNIDTLANLPIEQWLSEVLPRTTKVSDLRLVVDDARPHEELTNPAAHFEVTGDILELHHSPLQGTVRGDFQFSTHAGDDIGSADIQFLIPYRSGDWNASVQIDDLELAHLAQLAGPRVAAHLHGGRIMATLDIENDADVAAATRFDGILSAEFLRLYHGAVAADPIEVPDAGLTLHGLYNPEMEVPEAELLAEDAGMPDDDEIESGALLPPQQGGFIVEEAVASLGESEATMGLGLYGFEEGQRPARLDIDVDLQPTQLQTIVDAIPTAVLGPFEDISFAGTLRWLFSLEVPLHRASQMVWNAHVDLSPDFEVLYLPDEIDVFKLYDEFEHTIDEEWTGKHRFQERDFAYGRTVVIPEARPTPAKWFLENTTFELEELDELWRQREWPYLPQWSPDLGIDRNTWESPEVWLTSIMDHEIADLPWEEEEKEEVATDGRSTSRWGRWQGRGGSNEIEVDGEDESELLFEDNAENPFNFHSPPHGDDPLAIDEERYGPYVFVPLHYISPYMVRAIMTTEDTGFFTHSGFNYLAIRHSVEANLEAGRYVRGASTISMQLARNLFLDRSRVLVRKLQEVALVWLMESVADIPKERMMELYLNIIEFGPGVYGIHEASLHYFGKRPDELTIGESSWLVSIVPSPKRYHSHYERGEITPVWANRMRRYIRAMEGRERISEEEMEDALEEEVTFYFPEDGDPLLRDDLPASEVIDPDEIEPDDDVDDGDTLDDLPRSD